jgi:hypothetical protein
MTDSGCRQLPTPNDYLAEAGASTRQSCLQRPYQGESK